MLPDVGVVSVAVLASVRLVILSVVVAYDVSATFSVPLL
jgi:hypothetical protein